MRPRAERNRTIVLSDHELASLRGRLITLHKKALPKDVLDKTILQNTLEALDYLPDGFVDLVVADPPYNLSKKFNSTSFSEMEPEEYEVWMESWIPRLKLKMKPTASLYLCGDWKSSGAIINVLRKHFRVRNRITFEREKGRGAKTNWKNCSEDIWFCTVSDDYYFDVDAVKMKRRVIAPYKDDSGKPKDWEVTGDGKYRMTHPSNLWTDITIPFWSMPENTDHPTQKPEKMVAKIILASSQKGDVILDPFLGSGTTSVVAKKLSRHYVGIEYDELYCCLAEKRLEMASHDKSIQGYANGVFWERNSSGEQAGNGRRYGFDCQVDLFKPGISV